MTDLGTLGGRESVAWDINPAGQVVGGSQVATGVSAPIRVPLGQGRDDQSRLRIAPLGESRGHEPRRTGGGRRNAVDNGVLTDLGLVGRLLHIRQCDQLSRTSGGPRLLAGNEVYHAFLWDKGVMTDLGTLGETSEARGINSKGQIVGTSGNRAFVWENGVMTELISLDRRFSSQAEAINPAGEIVGYSNTERGSGPRSGQTRYRAALCHSGRTACWRARRPTADRRARRSGSGCSEQAGGKAGLIQPCPLKPLAAPQSPRPRSLVVAGVLQIAPSLSRPPCQAPRRRRSRPAAPC